MSFFRTADAVTAFYVAMLIYGTATEAYALTAAGALWVMWLLWDFVCDYDRCQTELRRMARED